MQVIKNYVYNASYQVFVLLVPLVTIPYLARILGPTGVGINSYTNSVIQYFILFGSIGVNLYGNRQVAFIRDDKDALSRTFYEIFFMRMLTILIAYLFFLIFLVLTSQYQVYYLAQSISLIAAAFDISWFFMGVENFAVTVLRNFIVKIITLFSIFVFVRSESDLTNYILILSLSLLVGNLTLFPSLKRYVYLPELSKLHLWKHLLPSLVLFIPQMATQIYLIVNKTMLGLMTSVEAAGYFDQSDKLIKMVLAIVTATGTVMLPHVANAFAKGEKEKTKIYLYRGFAFVNIMAVPMMFGLVAVTPKLVPLFFSDKFKVVTSLLIMEAIVILFISWGSVVGNQYLLPTKQMKSYTSSVILGAFVNVIMNIPLIYFWGARGAVITTVISEAVVSGYQLFSVRNQVNFHRMFEGFGKCMCAGLGMFIVVEVLDTTLPVSWTMLLLEIMAGIFTYLVLLILFRVQAIKSIIKLVKDRK